MNLLQIQLIDSLSGLSTIPFSIDNGNLVVTSPLDFENRDEYILRLTVRDTGNGMTEEIVRITILDEPDLLPKFVAPLSDNQEVKFTENTEGSVLELKAISQNLKPLGSITYKIKMVEPFEKINKFTISEINGKWFLVCSDKIHLRFDGREEMVGFTIEAAEDMKLTTDIKLRVRIISGDICK